MTWSIAAAAIAVASEEKREYYTIYRERDSR